MNNPTFSPDFEEQIIKSFNIPEIDSRFIRRLEEKLESLGAANLAPRRGNFRLRPAWSIGLALLILAITATLVIGPKQVAAAVGRLFGYIPDVGMVDEEQGFRVLAEPVSQTREGITVTVEKALAAADKTVVIFGVAGLPYEASAREEMGCSTLPGLILPDGQALQSSEGGGSLEKLRFVYPALPAGVETVTFSMPCILNALPGAAPEDWALPLQFVAAPDDLDVVPVFEVQPSLPPPAVTVEADEDALLTVRQALDIGDYYVLFVELAYAPYVDRLVLEEAWQFSAPYSLSDGNDQAVFYDMPTDLDIPQPSEPGGRVEVFRIAKDFKPPLTISTAGVYVSQASEMKEFTFQFDAGANPQPGQVWEINQALEIDGYETRLTKITALQEGYNFDFEHGPQSNLAQGNAHSIEPFGVEIVGFTPAGGGGGGGGGGEDGSVTSSHHSLVFENLPTGVLTVKVSARHIQSSEKRELEILWSPPSDGAALFGIRPQVDRWLETVQGYILIGQTEWTDDRIAHVAEYGDMKAVGADGRELAFEKLTFAEASTLLEDLQANQWAYRLAEKNVAGPVTLRLEKVNVEFAEPIRFDLDLRPFGFDFSPDQIGLGWKVGMRPLNLPGVNASLFKAIYLKEEDFSGFSFEIMADAWLKSLALDYESGVSGETRARLNRVGTNEANGALVISVLSDGRLTMPLGLIAHGADISGEWVATWSPAH